MEAAVKGIYVIGAKRTPFCKYGGSLRDLPASYAFAAAAKAVFRLANIDPAIIDNTIIGNVNYLSQKDGGKTARYCGLFSGVPIEMPALGINKACGSGLQALINAATEIQTGLSQTTLTGGTENMSTLPYLVRNVRFGTTLGVPYQFEDHIKRSLVDSYTGLTMEAIAEDVGKRFGVVKKDADEFAVNSYLKWKAAKEADAFKNELTSVTVTLKKKEIEVKNDEISKTVTNTADLETFTPVVDEGTVVTKGNISSPADGAAALVLSNEANIKKHSLQPLARLSACAAVGLAPEESALGAARAIEKLLQTEVLTVNDVDMFEINETCASIALITTNYLKLDVSKVNINGGALCMGHPVAATGARMVTHLVHQLRDKNLKRGIAASSCGGGQGVAVMVENI